jgi:hypothetical protein
MATTETFTQYFSGLATATTPLAGTEPLLVLQSGVTKQVAFNSAVLITANTTALSGFSANKFLYSDGSKVQAGTVSTGLSFSGGNLTLTIGGSNTDVLFNNSGAMGGDAGLTYTTPGVVVIGGNGNAGVTSLTLYNTIDQVTNYERGVFNWTTSSNVLTIGVQTGGSGTARDINFLTGSNINIRTNGQLALQVAQNPSSAVNYCQITGSATGNGVQIKALGTDSNLDLILNNKGTSNVTCFCNGANALQVSNPGSSVNYFTMAGAATGNSPQISAVGTDSNIQMVLQCKGSSGFMMKNQSANILNPSGPTNAANYWQIQSAVAGTSPVIAVTGSDTNIDIVFTPQGSGVVHFGTAGCFTANGSVATTMTSLGPTGSHTTIQEWLTVKNSSNVVRYIPAY